MTSVPADPLDLLPAARSNAASTRRGLASLVERSRPRLPEEG